MQRSDTPRRRRWIRAGQMACVFIAALWIATWWWDYGVASGRTVVGFSHGCFAWVHRADTPSTTRLFAAPNTGGPDRVAWFPKRNPNRAEKAYALPLWILFLLVVIPTGYLKSRLPKRFPPECCQSCGYDLTGNVTGVCSECGAALGTSQSS